MKHFIMLSHYPFMRGPVFFTHSKSEPPRTSRDEKRRAQHNEGEHSRQF